MPIRSFQILFACFLFLASADAYAGSPLYPMANSLIGKSSEEIPGKPIEERLVMGPISAKFWSKIQMIVADDDYIMNFPKLVDLFNLHIKEPIDAVSPNRPGIQSRRDATENSMRIKSMGYGLWQMQTTSLYATLRYTLTWT